MKARPAITLCAIAFAAYLVTDFAHESLGHGGMCLLTGGHLLLIDTTFSACSLRSHVIDGAGPVTAIVVALLAWTWMRVAPPRTAATRVFLTLVFAFAIFWNVGYLIKSGLLSEGDWHFVIADLQPAPLWHAGLAIAGIVLYVAAMRMLGAMMVRALPAEGLAGMEPFSFALIAYAAAALLSVAGALFDPRGPGTILSDALPSSLGAVGLVWVGYQLGKRVPGLRIAVPYSPAWIAVGVIAGTVFVAGLGPGLRF